MLIYYSGGRGGHTPGTYFLPEEIAPGSCCMMTYYEIKDDLFMQLQRMDNLVRLRSKRADLLQRQQRVGESPRGPRPGR